jgi:hypothetical protein
VINNYFLSLKLIRPLKSRHVSTGINDMYSHIRNLLDTCLRVPPPDDEGRLCDPVKVVQDGDLTQKYGQSSIFPLSFLQVDLLLV